MSTGPIRGAKKGGSRTPVESPDSLRSVQFAQLVDLLSEGEVEGLVNGLKSVYLDGVPLQNEDGTLNFDGVQLAFNPGTQGQAALPGIDTVQSEQAVGVEVVKLTPVVRTITNPSVDSARVTIMVPALSTLDASNGDLKGASFEYSIELQSNSGGFVEVFRKTISGKTTSTYKYATKFALTGPGPWDIRVTRITDDSTSSAVQNAFYWDSYTEIQSVKLRYPNCAVVGLQVSAKQFNRVPTRAYDLMGLRIQVPSNYDPVAGTYSGVWDGTFKIAWTNNPAWVFYAMCTNARWGLGQFIFPSQVDKWALYAIGQYCDEKVSNGYGGTEPRFTCNLYLQTRVQAYRVLQDLAAVFRGITYWGDSLLHVAQDAPGNAVMLFTNGNVVDGLFTYQSVSNRQRHSVFVCYYNDLTQLGKRVPEIYVDEAELARRGLVEYEMAPIGVTSRGQAHRLCRWAAYSEAAGEVVTFKAGAQAAVLKPGQRFQVADADEAGQRLGGRVHSATSTTVTLDADVVLPAGEAFRLVIMSPDPADGASFITESRAVTTPAGTTRTITVHVAFSSVPSAAAIWVLRSEVVEPTEWTCISRTESKADDGTEQYEVTGIAHDPLKYDAIEQGLVIEPRSISRLSKVPPAPTDMVFTETPYLVGATYRSRMTISWAEPARGLFFAVSWRQNGGGWTDMALTSANSVDLDGLPPGELEVEVVSQNALGVPSYALTGNFTVVGRAIGVACKVNTDLFGGTPNYNEAYIHGLTFSGQPIDAPGAIWINGAIVSVPNGVLFTNQGPERGWVVFDTAGANFVMNGVRTRYAFARKSGGQWQYDNNGSGWVDFTPGATHFLIGSMETGNADTGTPGTGPGISSMVMWTNGLNPEAVATLGESAVWSSITGSGKPADGATADVTLVARGNCAVAGNVAAKGGGAAWDSDVYSVQSYTAGAYAEAVPVATGMDVMFGLNSDPSADVGFGGLDFALYCEAGSNLLQAYESGAGITLGNYAAGDVLTVVYDNSNVRYLQNGNVLRTVAAPAGLKLYWDSSFGSVGATLKGIRFAPLSANDWGSIGSRPSDGEIKNNLLDSTWWQPGAAIAWGRNTSDAGDSDTFVWGIGPRGNTEALWQAVAGTDGAAAGGWNAGPSGSSNWFEIDPAKAYRFVVPVKKVSGDGQVFWGIRAHDVCDLNTTTENANPYFSGSATPALSKWHYMVGFVFPAGQTGCTHTGAGIYDATTGLLVQQGLNFNWVAGITRTGTRAYQYYSSAGATALFGKPMVHVVDGSEPSLKELLQASALLNSEQQWSDVNGRPKLYRVASQGLNDTHAPIGAGLYDGETGTLLFGPARSYSMVRISRATGAIAFSQSYDVYAAGAGTSGRDAAALAADLNATGPDYVVVVFTYDEPQNLRLTGGLLAAMKRCGASEPFFGASARFKSRSAYLLIGIAGCQEGNGFEQYMGDVDSDTNAWCDASFSIKNGTLSASGNSATPRSIIDYGYLGDLAATADVQLLGRGITVSGNGATKAAGSAAWDSDCYSIDSYTGGAYASAVPGRTDCARMFGLNADPTLDAGYASIDFAWYLRGDGAVDIYESGNGIGVGSGYSATDAFGVVYDNNTVQYVQNGVVVRTVAAPPGLRLYFDSSFHTVGGTLRQIRFGPMTARTRVWRQASDPGAAAIAGDTWVLLDGSGNEIGTYARYGGGWVPIRTRTYRQSSDPAISGTPPEGSVWQDTGSGREYVWLGGAWRAVVGDGSIDTAQVADAAIIETTDFFDAAGISYSTIA